MRTDPLKPASRFVSRDCIECLVLELAERSIPFSLHFDPSDDEFTLEVTGSILEQGRDLALVLRNVHAQLDKDGQP